MQSQPSQPMEQTPYAQPVEQEWKDITKQTPCELHVPFGYKRKTLKVAIGMALPRHKIHTRDIPSEYMRVSVFEIVPRYEDNEIEVLIPEARIEILQDVVGSFIMWKQHDVTLISSTPRSSLPPLSGHESFHTSQPFPGDGNKDAEPSPSTDALGTKVTCLPKASILKIFIQRSG